MNTIEISKMMHLTPNFRGVVPCCEIEQFKKHDVFGLIVNTDPHDKPGQHWIAIYKDGGKLSFLIVLEEQWESSQSPLLVL